MKKDIPVFTIYIAQKLLKAGYKIVNLSVNKDDPNKAVFYFEDEGEIHQALRDIQKNIKTS